MKQEGQEQEISDKLYLYDGTNIHNPRYVRRPKAIVPGEKIYGQRPYHLNSVEGFKPSAYGLYILVRFTSMRGCYKIEYFDIDNYHNGPHECLKYWFGLPKEQRDADGNGLLLEFIEEMTSRVVRQLFTKWLNEEKIDNRPEMYRVSIV